MNYQVLSSHHESTLALAVLVERRSAFVVAAVACQFNTRGAVSQAAAAAASSLAANAA